MNWFCSFGSIPLQVREITLALYPRYLNRDQIRVVDAAALSIIEEYIKVYIHEAKEIVVSAKSKQ